MAKKRKSQEEDSMAKKRKAPEEDPPQAKEVINLDDDDSDQEEEQETSSSSSEEESSSEESSSSSSEEEEQESSSSEEEEDSSASDDDSSSSSEEEGGGGHKNDDESSKKDKVRKLLEPFSKDQIIAFLKEEALKDPSILSRIVQKAESDPTHRKIFIHGLGWDTTEEQVLQVFKPFGEIEEFKLITDKATGRAKGYAFVQFKTRAAAKKALKIPQKKIGNRTASCQLAALGPAASGGASAGTAAEEVSKRKLFVANVGPNVNVDRLRDFFGKFGEIEDGPLGLDPLTNKPRGFAIFVYKSVDGLRKALDEPVKMFEGCQLNCKKFVEGLNNNNTNNNSSSSNIQQNQSDLNYGFGINPGNIGPILNAGGMLMPQNLGLGLVGNPMMAAVLNQSGLGAAAMPGIGGNYGTNPLSPSTGGLNQSGLAAAMAGIMGNYGMTSLSPSVIGNYGPPAALQQLGVFQSTQMGQSSVGANAAVVGTASNQAQSGIGSSGLALPSYLGQ